ncbi:hypothetical protein JCM19238_4198 [Vibrio ponticus]|nr:hypothetical protein JCM19238_4198 [Vibrio ponticus]
MNNYSLNHVVAEVLMADTKKLFKDGMWDNNPASFNYLVCVHY